MSISSNVNALAAAVRDKINLMMPRLMPSGGTTGQVLTKTSATNYAASWQTVSGSGTSVIDGNGPVGTPVALILDGNG